MSSTEADTSPTNPRAVSRIGRRRALLGAVVATVFLVAACGSEDNAASPAGSDADSGSEPESGSDTNAAVLEMTNVATGETITLDDALTPHGKPVLAWFWAPYCPTCRGEAPALDEFMASNSDRVDMVGIGSRNDFEYAEGFLADTGVTNFDLLWEPTGQSWVDNAVAAQPYMILIDADGEEVQRWPGGASVTQIEDALAELS